MICANKLIRPALIVIAGIMLAAVPAAGQTEWKLRMGRMRPGGSFHAMAYDAARERTVLCVLDTHETWEWNGAIWTRRTSAQSLPSRGLSAMAYDAARQRIVLFEHCSIPMTASWNETWEWDGATWIKQNPRTSPPVRCAHAMAYDTTRRRIVLFGGMAVAGCSLWPINDTWEWDGKNWIERSPRTSPPARYGHSMAYDEVRKRVVLFGGDAPKPLGDTWEWDGTNWVRCASESSPPPRYYHGMVYDRARQQTVLFGGLDRTKCLNDTWKWDGKHWHRCLPTTTPSARANHAMAYDEHRQRTVLFGGGGNRVFDDTWELAAVDLVPSVNFVSAQAGGNVRFTLDAGSRRAGMNYLILGCLDGSGKRGLHLGHVDLLLYPDLYFWLTLLYPSGLISNSPGTFDAQGRATATIRVPAGLPCALVDCRFYHAYVVFQSQVEYASTPAPLTITP
jgi:hypothetical protein